MREQHPDLEGEGMHQDFAASYRDHVKEKVEETIHALVDDAVSHEVSFIEALPVSLVGIVSSGR